MSERTCKLCGKRVPVEVPMGWYVLSVNVPYSIAPKGYVWIGMFCSPKCLALHMPEVRLMNDYTSDLYERDVGRAPEDIPTCVKMDEDIPQVLRDNRA